MKLSLSPPSRFLLIRGFLFVLALGSLYAAWENKVFLLVFPFLFISIADVVFALLFLYIAATLPKTLKVHGKFVYGALAAAWLYIVAGNIIGTSAYTYQLGLGQAAAGAGYSAPLYIASETLYIFILPTISFYIVWRFLKSL